jgi:hypothetical protein
MKNGTVVIFRKWRNGDIIALFPEISTDVHNWFCQSYEHVGQHGSADYSGVVYNTVPATPDEYCNLLQELKAIGYDDLIVRKRFNRT